MSETDVLDPRELVRTVLPEARRRYARSWEYLAAPERTPSDRRSGRATVETLAAEHRELLALVERQLDRLQGEDLKTARVLIEQITPLIDGWDKLATLSAHGVRTAESIRPDALGCGRRYRQPEARAGASRAVRLRPEPKERGRERGRPGERGDNRR